MDSPKHFAARASFMGQVPFFGGVFEIILPVSVLGCHLPGRARGHRLGMA